VPEPRYCGAPHPQHGQVTWGRIGVYTQTEGGAQNPMLTHIPPAPEVQGSVGSTQPHALTNPWSGTKNWKPPHILLPGQARPPHCGKRLESHGVEPMGKQAHAGAEVSYARHSKPASHAPSHVG
jgi:hypothetical protein